MKKRVLSMLLVFVLVFSGMTATSAAALPFTDVEADIWYYDAVSYVYENNLFNGTSETTFSPEEQMTRGMLVTVLYRLEGSPAVGSGTAFADVDPGEYYAKPIVWASTNGIVNGAGGGMFYPGGNVTREQIAAILFRYADWKGYDTSLRADLTVYEDRNSISDYAEEAMSWANAEGIITGNSAVTLNPSGFATRAEVAAMLMRFVLNVVEGQPENLADSIQTGGVTYTIGMTETELLAAAGQPREQLPTFDGYIWYVYGTDTYENLCMAGVAGGTVVALCASGTGFTYQGLSMGDTDLTLSEEPQYSNVYLFTDQNDNDILHSVLLEKDDYYAQIRYTQETLAGESKVNFHLVNAFRQYHGRSILGWSEGAATAARLHSQDMADQNYFSHNSLDGTDPWTRLARQGVSGCAENIAAGYESGVFANNGWINSSGHRTNMLVAAARTLGVGCGYNANSTYRRYYTQDFCY